MVGIRNFFRVAANVQVAASTVLVTTGLTSPIAINQKQKVRIWMPFTVGATGGLKVQIVLPAAFTSIVVSYRLTDTVTPASIVAIATNNNAFANALAVAGTHWIEIEADVVNGANAGNLDVQVACNSAANAFTCLAGASMDVIKSN